MFIFIKASYLAINQSNNIFSKIIGLVISFRWAYGWIEDFSQFDLSNLFLWIMIGMSFSKLFRRMTEEEIRTWICGMLTTTLDGPYLRNRLRKLRS
jgi:hypothetical protein